MFIVRSLSLSLIATIFLLGCDTAREMNNTEMGAVGGGVLGAGLGAVVGSATGNTGAGLAIGTAAGAATGGAVGYKLDENQEIFDSQQQMIAKQDAQIQAQRTQLDELRRMSGDRVVFNDTGRNLNPPRPYGGGFAPPPAANAKIEERSVDLPVAVVGSQPRLEAPPADLAPSEMRRQEVGIIEEEVARIGGAGEQAVESAAVVPSIESDTAECKQAAQEVAEAESASDVSDKLFHLRRALRLCPKSAEYHNRLGELYLSLNRKVDAEFEFKQALQYDPKLEAARLNLNDLNREL